MRQPRFSTDENSSTLDKMLSSLPRPSNPGPPPEVISFHSEIDAAPTPAISTGPRPITVTDRPGFFRRMFQKRPSAPSLRRRQGPQDYALPVETAHTLPPIPKNEAITLDTAYNDAITRKARLVYNRDDSITGKSPAAWLGGPGEERAQIRKAYMKLYNFNNIGILNSLRNLCNRLYLNGESQQLERILADFSDRWFECNPHNGFKTVDVVNLICYSLVILNGDLHRPEVENKMTRIQYLRNTIQPLADIAVEKVPDAFTDRDESRESSPVRQMNRRRSQSPKKSPTLNEFRHKRSFDCQRPTQRLSMRPSEPIVSTYDNANPTDSVLVSNPFFGKRAVWEKHIEVMLRKFYASLRDQPLPILPTENNQVYQDQNSPAQPSTQTLTLPKASILKRSPSMISKAGSEAPPVNRSRFSTHAWQMRPPPQSQPQPRSRPAPLSITTRNTSARSSFDQSSPPSPSSLFSKVSAFGKTQTTMSTYSLPASAPRLEQPYQQAIGFASALSHAIIKEESTFEPSTDLATDPNTPNTDAAPRRSQVLEDTTLELEGAPWAKEGLVKHKHVYSAIGRRARQRAWTESFAVISCGHLRLFSFTKNASSRWKQRRSWDLAEPGAVVGGGNWTDNAEMLAQFELRHVIATALPTNEYSRNRPHVWALSLPTGALHLFSVGTPEISTEFTETANYWSARMSKKPFAAGWTNANYGIDPTTLNPSMAVNVQQWTPPPPSMGMSTLLEVDQITMLTSYLAEIESEIAQHKSCQNSVQKFWRLRDGGGGGGGGGAGGNGGGGGLALANYDLKARYLGAEKAKVSTYVKALERAGERRRSVYEERTMGRK